MSLIIQAHHVDLDLICTNCYVDQDIEAKRSEQIIVNLKKSIEKAI